MPPPDHAASMPLLPAYAAAAIFRFTEKTARRADAQRRRERAMRRGAGCRAIILSFFAVYLFFATLFFIFAAAAAFAAAYFAADIFDISPMPDIFAIFAFG